jgi:glycosyltransferase involved in cell wall biosynthesis
LRIALFGARGIPHTYSGTETFFGELAPRLAERGHDVIVYCRRSLFRERPSTYRGVRLIYLPSIETKALSTPTHTLACICDVLFRNVDVMLVTNVANAVHCLVPRLFGKKVALNVDGVEWKRSKWSALGRSYFYQNARLAGKICPDGIVTDAVAMQGIYLEEFGTRSVSIAYGANIERSVNSYAVRRYGLEPFQYYLIASRLVPENNADLIMRGFERLKGNKVLAIAGDANYRNSFVDSLKQTRDPRVRFLGHVGSSEDVKELHCNCYAYVHGHSMGGTNPALLKALGYGNCVLALNTPFNREVVSDYGMLFENDPGDLTAKLLYLEEHPEEVVRYRERAPQRIVEKYSWDHVTDQYEDYFARLVAGERPALDRELGMYVPVRQSVANNGLLANTFEEHVPTRS